MKFILSTIATFFMYSITTQAQQMIDWDAVNSSLEAVVQDHVDNFEIIEDGVILVDKNKSNLDHGALSLSFNFNSSELNVLSSITPQRMALGGALDIQTTPVGSDYHVDFDLKVELKGELLVLLKHINQLFADCSSIDPTDEFSVLLCDYVSGVENAHSATELAHALTALKEALVSLFPDSAYSELKDLLVSMEITEQVSSILATGIVNNLAIFGLSLDGNLNLVFSDTGLLVQAKGSAVLNDHNYHAFVDILKEGILGLQNQDPDTLNAINGYSYFVFELLEGIFL